MDSADQNAATPPIVSIEHYDHDSQTNAQRQPQNQSQNQSQNQQRRFPPPSPGNQMNLFNPAAQPMPASPRPECLTPYPMPRQPVQSSPSRDPMSSQPIQRPSSQQSDRSERSDRSASNQRDRSPGQRDRTPSQQGTPGPENGRMDDFGSPRSPNTEYSFAGNQGHPQDPEYQAFLQWKENQKLNQQRPMGPVTVIPNQYRDMTEFQPYQNGYHGGHPGYGGYSPYGGYPNLGAAMGLPSQGRVSVRPGHSYGKITATGNARVIRGNVIDGFRSTGLERAHTYGDAEFRDNAKTLDGDVRPEQLREFWAS